MYRLSDYAFDLPEELIAHAPEKNRSSSRLLYLNSSGGSIHHKTFRDVSSLLRKGDLLVMNNTRVIPARLFGVKESGGRVEILILDYVGGMARVSQGEPFECDCLIKSSKRPKPGTRIRIDEGFDAEVIAVKEGMHMVRFHADGGFESRLNRSGIMPLPPYIKRESGDPRMADDPTTYQTVYASEKGAVAAPTAGLHFTQELLDEIREKGVDTAVITLHVGYGTFAPVRVTDIRDHQIHSERFHISEETARKINRAKQEGRRVIAVGTTSVRTLEYAARETGMVLPGEGICDLFIYPGYTFNVIDAMITNFHIPESTLLMLVSAFAGRENILAAYAEAVRERYRFFSYGDAMMIE